MSAQHGSISMYVHHKCRCEPCRSEMALYKRTWRYRRQPGPVAISWPPEPIPGHLPFEPVENAYRNVNVRFRASSDTLWRWRFEGLDIFRADQLCIAIGLHPYEVYGEAWYLTPTEEATA